MHSLSGLVRRNRPQYVHENGDKISVYIIDLDSFNCLNNFVNKFKAQENKKGP